MKERIINKMIEIRNIIVYTLVMSYFVFLVYPVVFIGSLLIYTLMAVVNLDLKELLKVYSKANEAYEKLVAALD